MMTTVALRRAKLYTSLTRIVGCRDKEFACKCAKLAVRWAEVV